MNSKELKNKILNSAMQSTESMLIEQKLNKLFDTDKENREERVGMHGSGIIASENDFCIRQQVLSFYFKGRDIEIPAGLKRVFLEGWHIHEKWQKLFTQAGIARGVEQRGHSELWQLLFTPDAIVELEGKLYVVEIKSVNTFQYKSMKTHPSGEKQCRLYMHFTGIPRGFVLAEDKNTQEFKIIMVDYDPVKIKPYIQRMYNVIQVKNKFLETGKLPKRNTQCTLETCKKASCCPYSDCCFGSSRIPLDDKQFKEMKRRWNND